MTVGQRIKKIRSFRGITQAELGLALGYDVKNADVRISQYESGYRTPKKDTLDKIAKILNCNYLNFYTVSPGSAEDIMFTFFWLDEDHKNLFHLHQMEKATGKAKDSTDNTIRYNDNDNWPAHPPVGIWFDYGLLNDFLREWTLRKKQLQNKTISQEEYFEWKLNWPGTSSKVDEHGHDSGRCSIKWRKNKKE